MPWLKDRKLINGCKKNIVLLSWGHSNSPLPGLAHHTSILMDANLSHDQEWLSDGHGRGDYGKLHTLKTTRPPPSVSNAGVCCHPEWPWTVTRQMRAGPLILLEPLTPQVFSHILPLWLHNLVPSPLSSLQKISCPRSQVVNPLSSTSS